MTAAEAVAAIRDLLNNGDDWTPATLDEVARIIDDTETGQA